MNLNFVNNFSAAAVVEPWISQSFPIVRMVLLILIAVLSFVMILTILFQEGDDGSGMNAMTGASADTFYSKNKTQTLTATLKRLTVVLAIVIAVLAVLFFVSVAIYNGN
ncbi:MAG: preprotein translocase subunit SecG [Clostridia bacterium]|nr:preprotein translocase subunit SecG [Clostridia bacterium]MBR7141682.1 preprotein translocase subunit SecG [Clostridia bacterium]